MKKRMPQERGTWNRSARRSGGARAAPLLADTAGQAAILGPLCALNRHALCPGRRCDCDCHATKKECADGR